MVHAPPRLEAAEALGAGWAAGHTGMMVT